MNLSAYSRMLMVLIIVSFVLILHQGLLLLWRKKWPEGEVTLPQVRKL
jgi:hypothetical protein